MFAYGTPVYFVINTVIKQVFFFLEYMMYPLGVGGTVASQD